MPHLRLALFLLALVASAPSRASGGPFGIDHKIHDDHGAVWNRRNQNVLVYGSLVTVGVGAVWLGGEDKLGNTFWRSVDSTTAAVLSTQVLKRAFRRERPAQTDDPNRFFKGRSADSFPSTEVATLAAAVTPFMVDYGSDHPTVYLLALLPAYDAVARVKTQRHWQSDVLIGALIGSGFGLWSVHRPSSWTLSVLPDSFQIGYRHHFD
ncbi:phosphatase PAP2 family protein [Dyella halodurans]|uniref:Phosphatase PAP2 family protein n=1 Tax=Dyella halodurans TaxID=1920171 RepID=A0ABV9C4Y0_9GAMM|nr:phosphatase PAP2 family protein [Dyella halodurans]